MPRRPESWRESALAAIFTLATIYLALLYLGALQSLWEQSAK